MPSRSFSDITQARWEKACLKLGLNIETKRGRGSHILIKHPRTEHKYTIQKDLHKIFKYKDI